MASCLTTHIGGVDVAVCLTEGVFADPDPRYREFVSASPGGDGVPITVWLNTRLSGRHLDYPMLFDPGEGWHMRGDGRVRWAVSAPPAFPEPVWAARFDLKDMNEVRVECGPVLRKTGNRLSNPVVYPLDLILVMYALAGREGLLLHAAGAIVDGKGYAFPGRSGAGKTTLVRQLVTHAGFRPLSDDRVIARWGGAGIDLFGTPWHGEAAVGHPDSAPLRGLIFPKRGEGFELKRLAPSEALERLLPAVSIPWYERELVGPMMDLCGRLVETVPAWELAYRPGPGAAAALHGALAGAGG